MGTTPTAPNGSITVEQFVHYLISNNIDSPKVFEMLCSPVNTKLYLKTLSRIDKINALARPRRYSKEKWEGRKNRLKGRLFESLVGVLLQSVDPFTAWSNVNTSTSEIDWVVQIGPTGNAVQALKDWGTHFLCEGKFSHDHVSIQWITNLNTVLQTHNSGVGVLFTTRGFSDRGNGLRARHQTELLSVMSPARFIVCFNGEDLHLCASGYNFLQLLSQRYMEAKAHTGRLKLLRQ